MNKKKLSIGIIILLLLTMLSLTVQAGSLRTVYGKVYIDGELAPDKTTVKLVFTGQEITNNTYDNGNYVMNFPEDNYEEGTFSVKYLGVWYPTNPPTVELGDEDELHYHVDLYVDTTSVENNPPNKPTLVSPSPSGKTVSGTTSTTLKVSVSDPDGDPMDVSFYNANGDVLLGTSNGVSSGGTASYSWTGLSPNTPYSWYAIANDSEFETKSDTWTFTTASGSSPPSGPSGSTYTTPTADANGPYYEYLDKILGYAEVTFDGSGSTGDITLYSWIFGDGTTGTGVSPKHKYLSMDNFTVTLNTSGPAGYSVAQTFAVITMGPNLPPTDPIVNGPQSGSANTDYDYTMVSTDGDNDSIKYIIDWDDGATKTTGFYGNGTIVTETHNWSAAGVYIITVKANDNATESGTTSYVVLIDAWWVKHIGYLLDTNGDGTYDSFYSNETGETTDVEKQSDGTYLINSDDDSEWDWIYDKDTDTLTEYKKSELEDEDNTLLYVGALLVILVLLGLVILTGRKKRKKEEPEKKTKKTNKK